MIDDWGAMGLLDKLITGGGLVVAATAVGAMYKNTKETQRRRASPLVFTDGLTENEFTRIATETAERTPRVKDVIVDGMTTTVNVRSNSGLSVWTFEVDFNDYGHLTGAFWLKSENSNSVIPAHYAEAVQAKIRERQSDLIP